jgi:DNA polymerase III epsilon subunit-like protein
LVEVSFALTNRAGDVLWDWSGKVKPTKPVAEEAAKINGYAPEKWERAHTLAEAADQIKRIASHGYSNIPDLVIPSGWHIWFDLGYYNEYLKTLLPFKLHHHPFDLMAYGWDLVDFHNKPHLRDLATALRITPGVEHTAAGDVYTYLECYRELRRRSGAVRREQA